MRIVICDDEKGVRDMLADQTRQLYPRAEISCCRSGEELLRLCGPPDILLLDIQMPGRNGMDIARELRWKHKKMILIFITVVEEYVFQAFDVGAFHYLVKPFSYEKFASVLQNAVGQFRELSASVPEREEKYLLIKTGGDHRKVFLRDIVYAEVFNRKVLIHMQDGDIAYYGRLSDLEKQAGEDFFRPHRAYLVHFKYVVRYNAAMIELEAGSALMAKQNYGEFVKRYLKYNQRKGRERLP